MTLPKDTRKQIYEHLCSWVDNFKGSDLLVQDDSKPFHSAVLNNSVSLASGFERSFSTKLGKTFEVVSHLVAGTRFAVAEKQHKLEDFIPTDSLGEMSRVEEHLNRAQPNMDYRGEVRRLVNLVNNDSSNKETRSVISDLYVRDKDGNETYFEIKSPKPNKEQCIKITVKHLLIHCIKRKAHPRVKTYYGMAYHPFGEGNPYTHSFALRYLDVQHQVLLGMAFWNYLGGKGAYEDVLAVYKEVGRDKAAQIRESIGLNPAD